MEGRGGPARDPGKSKRVAGTSYTRTGTSSGLVRIWTGTLWLCEHGKRNCMECCRGTSSFCEHGKLRTVCKTCGGGFVCELNKRAPIVEES